MSHSDRDLKRISKFLSLVLRHKPETIGLAIDRQGWADISQLLDKAPVELDLSRKRLDEVVRSNDKQRFQYSDDGHRIRANQGHSIDVELALDAQIPPERLYHGTAARFLDDIRREGLIPGSRQHVHLSADYDTAISVGGRHGKPVVLIVKARMMHDDGYAFYLSDNEVWLTDAVPPDYVGEDGEG